MKKFALFFSAILVLFACTSQAENQQNKTYKDVSVNEFMTLLETKNGLILDVRTPQEYAQGHLPHASNIDFNGSDFKNQLDKLDKTKPVFVYCARGGRSSSTVEMMKSLGFTEVYNMLGGFTAWSAAKLPSEL